MLPEWGRLPAAATTRTAHRGFGNRSYLVEWKLQALRSGFYSIVLNWNLYYKRKRRCWARHTDRARGQETRIIGQWFCHHNGKNKVDGPKNARRRGNEIARRSTEVTKNLIIIIIIITYYVQWVPGYVRHGAKKKRLMWLCGRSPPFFGSLRPHLFLHSFLKHCKWSNSPSTAAHPHISSESRNDHDPLPFPLLVNRSF